MRHLQETMIRIEYRCRRCRHYREACLTRDAYKTLRNARKSDLVPGERDRLTALGVISMDEQKRFHDGLTGTNVLSELTQWLEPEESE